MRKHFGKIGDKDIFLYVIKKGYVELTLTEWGASIVGIKAYGKEVAGGFDSLEAYLSDDSHQGATVGRVANRIDGCSFVMDGKEYFLPDNDGGATLHGGRGFSRRIWEAVSVKEDSICFKYLSKDGEEGFPSELEVLVEYSMTDGGFMIDYTAVPKGKTPISLTNHTYFNLNGFGNDVRSHKAIIYADRYTEVDARLIPTGNRPDTHNTLFDFSVPTELSGGIDKMGGYDHNLHLNPIEHKSFGSVSLALAAKIYADKLEMRMYTDRPCVQLYTGNFLGDGPSFKGEVKQVKHGAFCLEAQTEPNSVKKGENFFSPGEVYRQSTVYEFFPL